jgi:hypothetical protein
LKVCNKGPNHFDDSDNQRPKCRSAAVIPNRGSDATENSEISDLIFVSAEVPFRHSHGKHNFPHGKNELTRPEKAE